MKLAVTLTLIAMLSVGAPAHADVTIGDTGADVRQVQEHLKWLGYSVATDGVFGKQTEKAVRHFQRASGLEPDAIVGPLTAAALGIRGDQIQLTTPPTPPTPQTGCDVLRAYRIAAGLPEQFDAIGKRESHCTNTPISPTGCCVGAWQLHEIIFRDHRMTDRLEACGATWHNVRGDDPASWLRQACAAKALYDVMGVGPWAL